MKTKTCQCCYKEFQCFVKIDGKNRNLYNRKYCLICSPFGTKDKRHPNKRELDKDGIRKCSVCKELKFLELFTKSTTEKTGYNWYCKSCSSKKIILKQQKQKQKFVDYKGGKCKICDYSKCNRALHFHHLDPKEKDFTLGKYRSRSWETIKNELDKCILVCANCHAEIHDGIIKVGDVGNAPTS